RSSYEISKSRGLSYDDRLPSFVPSRRRKPSCTSNYCPWTTTAAASRPGFAVRGPSPSPLVGVRLRDYALRIALFSHDAERMIVLDIHCELLRELGRSHPNNNPSSATSRSRHCSVRGCH